MISKELGTTSCFVYVTPPGETEAVTAGRFERTTDRQGITTVGTGDCLRPMT